MDRLFSGIRLVSWDVDGTLFPYWCLVAPAARSVAHAFAREGWTSTARRIGGAWQFHRCVERQRHRSESKVDAAALARFEDAVAWERTILQSALDSVGPRRRVVSLMETFRDAGVIQVALSDFECASKVKSLGLEEYFAETYACERMGFWKPSPVPLAKIQQAFRIRPIEHLHIGDRPDTDGAACAANGCRFMPIDRVPRVWNVFNTICAVSAPE